MASRNEDTEEIINHDLAIIHAWASSWLVVFNPNKTEAILFTLKHDIRNPQLIFNDPFVKFVEPHKHLGVTLERNGQWHEHIESIIKSAYKILGIISWLVGCFGLNGP